jgi:hypothetical protein
MTTLYGVAAVIAALGVAIPAVVAAIYSVRNHSEVKSPNGTSTGQGVANVTKDIQALSKDFTEHKVKTADDAHAAKQAVAIAEKAVLAVTSTHRETKRSTDK